jgi:protein-S-isoprenylcysteine O-methyltransferase Ste14
MSERVDTANTVIRPPYAWAIAVAAGLGLEWLRPLPFVPASVPSVLAGCILFAAGLALAAWAIASFRSAGTRVETYKPTTAIVAMGPYRFTRNPIYLGMFLGLFGLAVGFDSLWLLAALAAFCLVIRYGVVAREEAYLERKFGVDYIGYKASVRRWL